MINFYASSFAADDMSPYAGVAKKLKLNPDKEIIPPSLLDNPESLTLDTLAVFVKGANFDSKYKADYDKGEGRTQQQQAYSYFTSPVTSNKGRCFYLYASHRLGSNLLNVVQGGAVQILYVGYKRTETSSILQYELCHLTDSVCDDPQIEPFPYKFTIEYIQKKLVERLDPDQQDKRILLRRQRTLTHIRLGTGNTSKKLSSDTTSNTNATSSSSHVVDVNEESPQPSSSQTVDINESSAKQKKKSSHTRERSQSIL